MNEIITMMSILFLVGMTKAASTRWLQQTLTEGNQKGAVDWLKKGEKVSAGTVYFGTAEQFKDDGYNIPVIPIGGEKSSTEFVRQTEPTILIMDRKDTVRRPLFIYQKTAREAFTVWLLEQPFQDLGTDKKSGIRAFRVDEEVELHFKRGNKKFDPYTIKVVDVAPYTEEV